MQKALRDECKCFYCVQVYLFKPIVTPYDHGTIIQTGKTCKKIPCSMSTSACRWLIVEKAKIFRSYDKHFRIFPHERNCRI